MKKVYILCDSTFLNYSSGINTFVVNLFNFIHDNFTKNVYLITDKHFLNINIYNKLNAEYIDVDNVSMNSDKYLKNYSNAIIQHFKNKNNIENSIFIANSLSTTMAIDILSNIYPKNKYISYTHIGDLIHNEYDSYDFPTKEKDEYLNILKKNNNIIVCTQSNNLCNFLKQTYNLKNVQVAEEISYVNNDLLKFPSLPNNDILIICSNYKRKRLDIMFDAISRTNYNVKLICKNIAGYYDIKKLINKYKIKVNIIQNIPNDKMIIHIKGSKLLLHISDIEFFPYSVLESSFFIPTLINSDTEWGKLFPNELTYKVNSREPEEIAKKIEKYIKLNNLNDYDVYYNKCIKSWKKIIGDVID